MASVDTCLSLKELRDHLAANVSKADAERIDAHLKSCAACRAQCDQLRNRHESWVHLLQEAGLPQALGELPAATDDASHDVSNLLPGYRVLNEISRGGQGIVYRAKQLSTHRDVAIKVLREGPFASPEERRRFEREIDLVAGFRHPGIVTVFDSGRTTDGHAYCVMDFVDGLRLDHYLTQSKVTLDDVLSIFLQICDAVNYAHQRGVIHRDLKPGNVLVTVTGPGEGGARPHILDFGLAKQVSAVQQTQLTIEGMVAGTLPYLAPEQTRTESAPDIDIRSDVYSLGVMLFEALTGQYPYPVRGDLSEVLRHIATTSATRFSSLSHHAATDANPSDGDHLLAEERAKRFLGELKAARRDELETIVQKVLAKEPERRYQTVGELAQDIERFRRGEPIEAKRDSGWYQLRKLLQRRRKTVIAGIFSLAILSASVVGLSVLYYRAQSAEAKAKRRLDDVRDVSRTFIFKLAGQIGQLSGATKARQTLAESAVKFLNNIAQDIDPDDAALNGEFATAYALVGDLYGDPTRPNLGRLQESVACYKKSIHHISLVTKKQPGRLMTQVSLASVHNRLARVLGKLGQGAEGRRHLREAERVAAEAYRQNPKSRTIAMTYADCLALQAMDLLHQAKADDAKDLVDQAMGLQRESMAILAKFDDGKKQRPDLWHDWASSNGMLGQANIQRGDWEAALEFHAQSLAFLEKAVAARPNNLIFKRDCAIAGERVGHVLQNLQRSADAAATLARALDLVQEVSRENPRDRKSRSLVPSLNCRLGEIALADGQEGVAHSHFSAYLSAARALTTDYPDDPGVWRDFGVAHYKFVEFHLWRADRTAQDTTQHVASLQAAHDACQSALTVFHQMEERGMLARSDASVPKMLKDELLQIKNRVDAVDRERDVAMNPTKPVNDKVSSKTSATTD